MPDLSQLERNLAALHEEVCALRRELDGVARLEREATVQDVLELLTPALACLARLEADDGDESPGNLARLLVGFLAEIGVSRIGRPGEVQELWPDEAAEDVELDREVPAAASLVRVEIQAAGWARGRKVIVRPLGRVIEVVDASDE